MTAREVELTGGSPWGFRMHGGVDQNQPLRISRRYSDSLERILEVNPGRKASLSGIREGDVISSINGRPTKGITNGEAHALLRSAGPVLKLGLNEDREMSPRRRSIGRGSELKRPSQLITDLYNGPATPQAPVYATIRPSNSPQHRNSSSCLRSSLNSIPTALSSTPLVKSVMTPDNPVTIHPTNPFYTTLPSNSSSSPSRLPIPNGRTSYSSLDRAKTINNREALDSHNGSDNMKSPYLSKVHKSGPSSLPQETYIGNETPTNGYGHEQQKTANDYKSDPFSYDSLFNRNFSNGLPHSKLNYDNKDVFDTSKLNSDPFEKYLKSNTNYEHDYTDKNGKRLSENAYDSREEYTKRSTVTEHKISEIEEVKTIKKIIMNGSGDELSQHAIDRMELPNTSATEKSTNCENHRYNSDGSNQFPREVSHKEDLIDYTYRTPKNDDDKYSLYASSSKNAPNSYNSHNTYNCTSPFSPREENFKSPHGEYLILLSSSLLLVTAR